MSQTHIWYFKESNILYFMILFQTVILTVVLVPIRVIGILILAVIAWCFVSIGLYRCTEEDLMLRPLKPWRRSVNICAKRRFNAKTKKFLGFYVRFPIFSFVRCILLEEFIGSKWKVNWHLSRRLRFWCVLHIPVSMTFWRRFLLVQHRISVVLHRDGFHFLGVSEPLVFL